VRRAEVDATQRAGTTSAEHARIKRLKRENELVRRAATPARPLTQDPGAGWVRWFAMMAVVIEVALGADPDVPTVVRSFAACLASVTERPLTDIPQPRTDLRAAIGYWRNWLAGHGAGLVPIAGAARFHWPGYWIAIVGDGSVPAADTPGGTAADMQGGTAVLMFGTPSGVVLSPQEAALLGSAAADLPVQAGYALAWLDPAFTAPAARLPRLRGQVEAIALAERATGPVRLVQQARAVAGHGLEGDRYAAKAGTFTPRSGAPRGYDLTLIEAEVLDALRLPGGGQLGYAQARRNLITRGIDLNPLVGRRFRVGEAECAGQRLCEPCAHLERLTTSGVLRGLIHRGGLRADVLTDGDIRIGTVIETID
jgi:MOSC domain-containing protein YiiM